MLDKKLLQQRVREIYEESLDLIERDTDDEKMTKVCRDKVHIKKTEVGAEEVVFL